MQIQIFSDLHCDARPGWIPSLVPGADLVVCAGDVCEGMEEALSYLRVSLSEVPIVTVAGNHSFYRRRYPEEMASGLMKAERLGIVFLECAARVIEGVRFVGATLWTDYALYGEHTRPLAMDVAHRRLNDHRLITWQREPWLRFRPEEALHLHRQARASLDRALAEPFDGPTVVVTHHAPSMRSIAEQYRVNDPHGNPMLLNAAFSSDLEPLIELHQPALWVHGHTHHSFDYPIGRTRVVCNPHGYGSENAAGFNPHLVVEV